MREFEGHNPATARSVHTTPPDVERVLHTDDVRREKRSRQLIFAVVLIVIGAALLAALKF